jgi:hypothetical protein
MAVSYKGNSDIVEVEGNITENGISVSSVNVIKNNEIINVWSISKELLIIDDYKFVVEPKPTTSKRAIGSAKKLNGPSDKYQFSLFGIEVSDNPTVDPVGYLTTNNINISKNKYNNIEIQLRGYPQYGYTSGVETTRFCPELNIKIGDNTVTIKQGQNETDENSIIYATNGYVGNSNTDSVYNLQNLDALRSMATNGIDAINLEINIGSFPLTQSSNLYIKKLNLFYDTELDKVNWQDNTWSPTEGHIFDDTYRRGLPCFYRLMHYSNGQIFSNIYYNNFYPYLTISTKGDTNSYQLCRSSILINIGSWNNINIRYQNFDGANNQSSYFQFRLVSGSNTYFLITDTNIKKDTVDTNGSFSLQQLKNEGVQYFEIQFVVGQGETKIFTTVIIKDIWLS